LEPESTELQPGLVQDENPVAKATGWLLNPRCKLDGATPEKRRTKHLFLRLDRLSDKIASWFNEASKGWTANAVSITQSWIDKGLYPRAITRDLRWGVPIPRLEGLSYEEYKNKVL
jgi:methionyl-tRNA synthetase